MLNLFNYFYSKKIFHWFNHSYLEVAKVFTKLKLISHIVIFKDQESLISSEEKL